MKFLSLSIILLMFSVGLQSQELRTNYKYKSKYAFALGLATTSLFGDNPAGGAIVYNERNGTADGGFTGAQNGIDLRVTRYFGEEDQYRIPLGVSLAFFSAGALRYNLGEKSVFNHELLLADIYTGWHYSFLRFPLANAQVWAGIELHGIIVTSQKYSLTVSEVSSGNKLNESVINKDDQFRLGPLFRLGFDGELQERIMVNISGGAHLLNLFFRDDSQGNLLLAKRGNIKNETYAWAFTFSLLIQYRL